jgi:hypothetical protein
VRELNVLTINTGSSSLKMTKYSLGRMEKRMLAASVDRIGSLKSLIHISDQNNGSFVRSRGQNPGPSGCASDSFGSDRRPTLPLHYRWHRTSRGAWRSSVQSAAADRCSRPGGATATGDDERRRYASAQTYGAFYLHTRTSCRLARNRKLDWTDDFSDPVAPSPIAGKGVQTFTNA